MNEIENDFKGSQYKILIKCVRFYSVQCWGFKEKNLGSKDDLK